MKKVIFLITLIMLLVGCSSQTTKESNKTTARTGIIQPIEMSTWNYGTHILFDNSKKITVALTSKEDINLEDYKDGKVEVTGELKEGYPIDGGPEYLEVRSIKVVK